MDRRSKFITHRFQFLASSKRERTTNKRQARPIIKALRLFLTAALLAWMALSVILPSGARAAEIDVACDVSALINAINTANGNGQADTINLETGCTYTLTAWNNETDGYNGLPSITSQITINGNGATIERSSGDTFRIFHVASGGDLTLSTLTIANGDAGGRHGGGIYNGGVLNISHSTLSGKWHPQRRHAGYQQQHLLW